jgi:hypothetical protein
MENAVCTTVCATAICSSAMATARIRMRRRTVYRAPADTF